MHNVVGGLVNKNGDGSLSTGGSGTRDEGWLSLLIGLAAAEGTSLGRWYYINVSYISCL